MRSYCGRTYRVVKLVIDGRHAWMVVSSSLRDDETWDVIYRGQTRTECWDYIEEVVGRNRRLIEADALVVLEPYERVSA